MGATDVLVAAIPVLAGTLGWFIRLESRTSVTESKLDGIKEAVQEIKADQKVLIEHLLGDR